MDNDNKIEQALFRILDYRSEHNVDDDSILIMLSLLNLMGMVNVLNVQKGDGAAGAGTGSGLGNMETLLGPLMALMASGMGKGPTAGGEQGAFNPAALLSLLGNGLGGGRSKGGAPDLSALLGLLGPLLGLAGNGPAPDRAGGAAGGPVDKPRPVQREINLDEKNKAPVAGAGGGGQGNHGEKKERPPKPGEVLKWNFGT